MCCCLPHACLIPVKARRGGEGGVRYLELVVVADGCDSLLGACLSGDTAIVSNDQAFFPADALTLFQPLTCVLKRYLANFVLFQNCMYSACPTCKKPWVGSSTLCELDWKFRIIIFYCITSSWHSISKEKSLHRVINKRSYLSKLSIIFIISYIITSC